jgi:arylformamidase
MDAPLHFLAKGKSIDQLPFDTSVGPARIIEIKDPVSIKVEELQQHNIKRGERILFKTRNSPQSWKTKDFANDFVFITKGAAKLLADTGVKLVGVDYLSVGSPADPDMGMKDVHDILLGAEIWLIEGLDLTKTTNGNVNLICLPLRLMNTEGSPVRAIVQPIK